MSMRMRIEAAAGADDGNPIEAEERRDESLANDFIPRADTVIRAGFTLLFVVVASVLETLLALVVVFELGATLVTERPPSPRVRDFANRIVSYYYRLGRWMTYNESRLPFPFSDFPDPVEPDAFVLDAPESDAGPGAAPESDAARVEP
jgi:hypothetical protein